MSKENRFKVGSIHESIMNGKYKILSMIEKEIYEIEFLDTGYKRKAHRKHFYSGKIKDYMKPNLCGVGYYGKFFDKETTKQDSYKKIKKLWENMLCRLKYNKSYQDCSVCDRWLNFSNFYEDVQKLSNYNLWLMDTGLYQLDKDGVIAGNKIYSPEACMFLPACINHLEAISRRSKNN